MIAKVKGKLRIVIYQVGNAAKKQPVFKFILKNALKTCPPLRRKILNIVNANAHIIILTPHEETFLNLLEKRRHNI